MGLFDPAPYKVTNNIDLLDATTQDSMLDGLTAVINALVNANIDPAAAIDVAKLAAGSNGLILKVVGGVPHLVGCPNPGPLVIHKTTTTDINNTTSLTSLTGGGLTIPAGAIGANGIVRVHAWGDYQNNGGSVSNFAWAPKIGGTALANAMSISVSSGSSSRVMWSMNWLFNNLNATNSQAHGGQFFAASFVGGIVAVGSAGGLSTSIDTTASVVVDLTISMGLANAATGTRCHGMLVEVYNG